MQALLCQGSERLSYCCCRQWSMVCMVCRAAAGYAFHKALGAVNLAHVVQFGRAADIYRLCKVGSTA